MALVMRLLGAVLSGAALALAFPLSLPRFELAGYFDSAQLTLPGGDPAAGYGQLSWLALVALVPVLGSAAGSRSWREAFGWGYLSGILWLLLHWDWLGSFGLLPVVLLSAYFALPVAAFTAIAHLIHRRAGPGMVCWGSAVVWTAVEYIRSFGFWAFPWNLLGYSQVRDLPLIQIADIGGVYAVGFLVALANCALWLILLPGIRLRLRLGHACLAGAVLLAGLAYGHWRLAQDFTAPSAAPLQLALVQGGLDTFERWSEGRLNRTLDAYIPPSRTAREEWQSGPSGRPQQPGSVQDFPPGASDGLLLVWPESVLPRTLDPRHLDRFPDQLDAALGTQQDVGLLMGAIGRPRDDEHAENGILLLEPGADPRWVFSKIRLVPYGEVVPLRQVARFLDYPWGDYDISGGHDLAPLSWGTHTLALGVCFDNVFGFLWRQQVQAGAQGLLLVTNNSWYRLASGIRQHCDMDILRAVEFRRPMARVSTTGWSHLIDPAGRVLAQTDVYKSGVINAPLPVCSRQSVYLLIGDVFAQLCLLAAAVVILRLMILAPSEGML